MSSQLDTTIDQIQPLDAHLEEQAQQHLNHLTKPPGSLGRLEELARRYVMITGQSVPRIGGKAKAVVVFAADHGVTAEGVSAYPQDVTAQMVLNFINGGAAINALARQAGADVHVVDIGVMSDLPALPKLTVRKIRPSMANIARGPAMSREDAQQA